MGNSLLEEIRSLSDEQLNEYIETFQDRVESTRDYLDDADDYTVSMVLRNNINNCLRKMKLSGLFNSFANMAFNN